MRNLVLALGLLLLVSIPAHAQAVVTIPQTAADEGRLYPRIGETMMTTDQSSILACLKDVPTQTFLWKAQFGGNNGGSFIVICGAVVSDPNCRDCAPSGGSCDLRDRTLGCSAGNPNNGNACGCPDGYTPSPVSSSMMASTCGTGGCGGADNVATETTTSYQCVK
jgi:hypothetical protein